LGVKLACVVVVVSRETVRQRKVAEVIARRLGGSGDQVGRRDDADDRRAAANLRPFSAVEKIELLGDGRSAYGITELVAREGSLLQILRVVVEAVRRK